MHQMHYIHVCSCAPEPPARHLKKPSLPQDALHTCTGMHYKTCTGVHDYPLRENLCTCPDKHYHHHHY